MLRYIDPPPSGATRPRASGLYTSNIPRGRDITNTYIYIYIFHEWCIFCILFLVYYCYHYFPGLKLLTKICQTVCKSLQSYIYIYIYILYLYIFIFVFIFIFQWSHTSKAQVHVYPFDVWYISLWFTNTAYDWPFQITQYKVQYSIENATTVLLYSLQSTALQNAKHDSQPVFAVLAAYLQKSYHWALTSTSSLSLAFCFHNSTA